MVRKGIKIFFGVACFIALVIACKHEIPDIPSGSGPAGSGTGSTGGGNTQPLITCSSDTVYFQQQVLPIFISNCSVPGCHDAITRRDGVNLTTYATIISTGDIRPGRPDNSEVYEKITEHDNDDRMPPPPRNRLSQQQVDLIYKWIMQGAKNNSCQASACDSINVTFTVTIKPIITNKCQGCHSSSAPAGNIDLTTHNGIKTKISDGRLWGAVNHLPGFSAMPKNGAKLSDCELTQIRKWIDAGAPNN